MRLRIATLAAVALILARSSALAENLLDIYRIAARSYPEYIKARNEFRAFREKYKQAGDSFLPRVSFGYDYTRTHQQISQSGANVFSVGQSTYDVNESNLKLTQPVFAMGAVKRVGQAKIEVDRAVVQMESARQDLILLIATRYLEALAFYDAVSLTRAEEKALVQHMNLADERIRNGLGRVTDLHDARARLQTVRARHVEGDNRLKDALEALAEVVGSVPVSLVRLKQDIPLLTPSPEDEDEWVDSALKQNLSLAVARSTYNVATQEVSIQKSALLPTVNLTGRRNERRSGGSLFGGGSDVETHDVLVSLDMPIYQGGVVGSRTKEAVYQQRMVQQDLIKKERTTVRETRQAYSGITTAIGKVKALSQSVASQQLALDSKRTSLDSGLASVVTVLDAQRDMYQAKYEYSQARYDYLLNSLRLKRSVGTLSETDVHIFNNWLDDRRSVPATELAAGKSRRGLGQIRPDPKPKLPQFSVGSVQLRAVPAAGTPTAALLPMPESAGVRSIPAQVPPPSADPVATDSNTFRLPKILYRPPRKNTKGS